MNIQNQSKNMNIIKLKTMENKTLTELEKKLLQLKKVKADLINLQIIVEKNNVSNNTKPIEN